MATASQGVKERSHQPSAFSRTSISLDQFSGAQFPQYLLGWLAADAAAALPSTLGCQSDRRPACPRPLIGLDATPVSYRFSRRLQKPAIFHDTTHATKRRSERDLSLEEMKSAVLAHGHRIQQRRGEHGGFVYEFRKTIRGKVRSVIAEVKKEECWLITVIPPDEEK